MIQPVLDWILVRLDPKVRRSSVIEIVGDEDTTAVRTGTILSTGLGRRDKKGGRIPLEVKEGDRIAFLRWHEEHRPGKTLKAALERLGADVAEDIMLVRQNDILFVFEGDVMVDV